MNFIIEMSSLGLNLGIRLFLKNKLRKHRQLPIYLKKDYQIPNKMDIYLSNTTTRNLSYLQVLLDVVRPL